MSDVGLLYNLASKAVLVEHVLATQRLALENKDCIPFVLKFLLQTHETNAGANEQLQTHETNAGANEQLRQPCNVNPAVCCRDARKHAAQLKQSCL